MFFLAMKVHDEEKAQFRSFLISAVDECESLASRFGRLKLGDITPVGPLNKRLGEP
jgi:hypothetical protein